MATRLYRIYANQGNGVGLMNRKGKVIVEPQHVRLFAGDENRHAFRAKEKKWGYYDSRGKVAIEPRFDAVGTFSDGLAGAVEDDRRGFIDLGGEWVFAADVHHDDGVVDSCFSEGLAGLETDDGIDFIDTAGKRQFSLDAEMHWGFEDGLAAVGVSGQKWGFVDRQGEWVIPPTFRWAEPFSQGMARVEVRRDREQFSGYINDEGTLVIEPIFSYANSFSQSVAAAALADEDGYGYINKRGKWKLEPQFRDADNFSEGLAAVSDGEKHAYINKQGEVVLQSQEGGPWCSADDFEGGIAMVSCYDHFLYVDKQGAVVWNQKEQ